VHSSKDIWFAALPVPYKTLEYVKDPSQKTAPSQVKFKFVVYCEKISPVLSVDLCIRICCRLLFNRSYH